MDGVKLAETILRFKPGQVILSLGAYPSRYQSRPGTSAPKVQGSVGVHWMILSGCISLKWENECIDLLPGTACYIGPGERFRSRVDLGNPSTLLRFRSEHPRKTSAFPRFLHVPNAQSLAPWMQRIIEEAMANPKQEGPLPRILLAGYWAEVGRVSASSRDAGSEDGFLRGQRMQIRHWVTEHAQQPLDSRQLARELGYSHDYFSRKFRRTFGCSPRVWLAQQRLRLVAEVVRDSHQSIAEIAHAYGYCDPYHFSREFRRVIGVTPTEWRKEG